MSGRDVLNCVLRGSSRVVAAEVYFRHLADVCRGIDLSGEVVIEVDSVGRVYVNGLYVPARGSRAEQPLLVYATGVRK